MSYLQLKGISKKFDGVVAVDDFDLDVSKGEIVALLGPSGCGKTTTLHMIAGFVEPTTGSISVDGGDLRNVPVERRNIGIVFQSYALFPHLSVADNVAFGLEMRNVDRRDRRRRVDHALELVHLVGYGDRYPRELSGGQQQRVALARALVIEPTILLLDEPLSNLDAKLREDMQIELRQLQRNLGITTILVTHDQNEAMAISDRIAVMNGGRVIQIDDPFGGYERPATEFVAGFLGKANLFNANIQSRSDELVVTVGDKSYPHRANGIAEGSYKVCVRPEKMRFCSEGEALVSGTIATRIFLGQSWVYQITTKNGAVLVSEQNNGNQPKLEGDAVHLFWRAESAHFIKPG